MPLTWTEQLENALVRQYGKKTGQNLFKKYAYAFSRSYNDEYPVTVALDDITHIEQLSDQHPLEIRLYYLTINNQSTLHLRLFQWRTSYSLSDVLPMLENLGLRTNSERPHRVELNKEDFIWISDFSVVATQTDLDIKAINDVFEDAFSNIYFGLAENDGFNKLVLSAALSSREISVLRAYAKYLRQVEFRFSQPYIEKALTTHPDIAKQLVQLFIARFDPAMQSKASKLIPTLQEAILHSLELVTSLDEDRIMRRLLEVINATLRTNYFQKTNDGKNKPYISFKLNSRVIPDLPLPMPLYEIFVYSPRFEAIHLRNAKVARGGIRWSDRREDFRTEVLGLMKAQVVKNAVIVPSGAKGGFVLKTLLGPTSREILQAEVIHCYSFFMRGLLDLTDNIVGKKYVAPPQVVYYDDADPYLVVAADKGTASFSDLANDIAKEYNFWLGDAFASGGSTGYDHKKMGITARGAWESIKRHFRELDINVLKTTITVVGIGDMSGDVFGNGMLYSKHIKLLAAFDHRHIFIDPSPDPKISYQERARLFKLPTSSWEDYNPKLISAGGGVFKRSLKSITITSQMKKALGIEENSLTPNDLIRAILKAPVELLYNGGIGTYVKSSQETNVEVGDRTNDYCRVDGGELRCKVVCEGGNLGFTQLGRVEYALKGGLINTDFIDNSAGVDCSDHEVNLKILLDHEVQKNKLTYNKRNALLASLTDEVASLVLEDNFDQAWVMSFSAFHAEKNLGLHINYINELESLGVLNRKVEFLPDDKELIERKSAGKGLTRPELAVLLAYTKIHIKHAILDSNVPEDPYLKQIMVTAFPPTICKKYKAIMSDHRLHRDIIATQLSNLVVNEMGITFVYRLQIETGASIPDIIRAHAVASNIFGTKDLEVLIRSLDFNIPLPDQYDMLFHLRNLINLAARWFLHTTQLKGDLEQLINHYQSKIKTLAKLTPTLMGGLTKKYLENLTEKFQKIGLAKEVASRIATYRAIYTSLNIIAVATNNNFDLIKTAKVYFIGGERINLVWFRDQLANDTREGHWNALARLTLRDEFDIAQRALTVAIMDSNKHQSDATKLVDFWMQANQAALARWEKLLTMLHGSNVIEYTMFFIAVRELIGLIANSQS